MQQGDRMQLNRLKMAIQYRQKKVSREWKSFKCASITNFVLSSMTTLRFLSRDENLSFQCVLCAVFTLVCLDCVSVWIFGFVI